jgi:hypothetical protein
MDTALELLGWNMSRDKTCIAWSRYVNGHDGDEELVCRLDVFHMS